MKMREKTILYNDKTRDGFVVLVTALEKIKDGLTGHRILIKQLKRGKLVSGNLYYEWLPKKHAFEFFDMACRTLNENLDNFTEEKWNFSRHPIQFVLKHRN